MILLTVSVITIQVAILVVGFFWRPHLGMPLPAFTIRLPRINWWLVGLLAVLLGFYGFRTFATTAISSTRDGIVGLGKKAAKALDDSIKPKYTPTAWKTFTTGSEWQAIRLPFDTRLNLKLLSGSAYVRARSYSGTFRPDATGKLLTQGNLDFFLIENRDKYLEIRTAGTSPAKCKYRLLERGFW